MTLSELLTEISLDYDASSSTPSTSSTEYARRVKLINRFERAWARELNYKWNDLLKSSTVTITSGNSSASLPSDFKFGNIVTNEAGEVKIGNSYYQLVRKDEVGSFDTDSRLCWVTGNDAQGYTINIQPTATDNLSVTLDYFTTNLAATSAGVEQPVLVDGTDESKCPDPYYIVYSALGVLYKADDDEIGRGMDYERLATESMSNMIANNSVGGLNQVGVIPDYAEVSGYSYIGD